MRREGHSALQLQQRIADDHGMTATRARPETIAFFDYLQEHASAKNLGEVAAELLARLGRIAPARARVDDHTPQRRAS